MNIDRAIIAGNLTHDPAARQTPKGIPVTSLSLAVNRKWKNPEGDPQSQKVFFEIIVFGKLAEQCTARLKKGSAVMLEGRHEMQTWICQTNGEKRSKLVIIGEYVHFQETPRDGGDQ
jgi:single-strand DNA-binding protein